MLQRLTDILKRKYPRLRIDYEVTSQIIPERIYIDMSPGIRAWTITIYNDQIWFNNHLDYTYNHQDISPSDPGYFDELDKIISNASTTVQDINKKTPTSKNNL